MYQVEDYVAPDGRVPFRDWLGRLRDKAGVAKILKRLDQVEQGSLGDWKTLTGSGGVAELRLHFGPGYRIYFAFVGTRLILLLAGSDKASQRKAIKQAQAYLDDHRARTQP